MKISEEKWCLSLARMLSALFNFYFKVLMWFLKRAHLLKHLDISAGFFRLIFWPLKWKFIFLVICHLRHRNIRISVLLTLTITLFAHSHWTRFDKSKFIFLLKSLREVLAYNRFVSSVKWCILEFFIEGIYVYQK